MLSLTLCNSVSFSAERQTNIMVNCDEHYYWNTGLMR